ncbi:MAG: hypothetical protein QXP60_02475 [Nitrososphaerota archaeon]
MLIMEEWGSKNIYFKRSICQNISIDTVKSEGREIGNSVLKDTDLREFLAKELITAIKGLK